MQEKFYTKFTNQKSSSKNQKKQKPSHTSEASTTLKFSTNKKPNSSSKEYEPHKKNFTPFTQNAQILEQSSLFSQSKLEKQAQNLLENFDTLIQEIRPLNSRQLRELPDNIRNLSHQMTDDRASRRLGYMNENVQLSAYVRYFVWWNLVRLSKLFSNMESIAFPDESLTCLDLGSGPLTVVTALWISRPELRNLNLTWYCLDVSQNTLTFGEDIFMSAAAKLPPSDSKANPHWKIIRIKDSFGTNLKQKAGFITCANMFNELDQASTMPPEYQTKKYFDQLKTYSTPGCKYILIEPGIPKAARTLSLFRTRFIANNYSVFSPCPHAIDCPMNGFKAFTGSSNKWCNFAFSTVDAPQKLLKLSTQAKLQKDRAVLSFICAFPNQKATENVQATNSKEFSDLSVRIVSDPFKLPDSTTGFYACSNLGLTLIKTVKPELYASGTKLLLKIKNPDSLPQDKKSGAKVICI